MSQYNLLIPIKYTDNKYVYYVAEVCRLGEWLNKAGNIVCSLWFVQFWNSGLVFLRQLVYIMSKPQLMTLTEQKQQASYLFPHNTK